MEGNKNYQKQSSEQSTIKSNVVDRYYRSDENMNSSINLLYCKNVLSKTSYRKVRNSCKTKHASSTRAYEDVMRHIRKIDIGTVCCVNGVYVKDGEEAVKGMFRPLKSHALKLAELYCSLDASSEDKLAKFPALQRKDQETRHVFAIAIGTYTFLQSNETITMLYIYFFYTYISYNNNWMLNKQKNTKQ